MGILFEINNPYGLKDVQNLCEIKTPYETSEQIDNVFIIAMRQICDWHMSQNSFYYKLTKKFNFNSNALKTIEDCAKIPILFAHFFKTHVSLSIPFKNVYVRLTSSGTSGQKSQMFFDEWTLKSAQRMVEFIFRFYKWVDLNTKVNYLLFSYEPTSKDFNIGTSYTDNFLCSFTAIKNIFYALRYNGISYDFDYFGTIQTLLKYERESVPVRIFGFPAFLYFTLQKMQNLKIKRLELHPESLVFLGGGWKTYQDKKIEKRQLYKMISSMLGIEDSRIRDGFGSVEHCVPYIECSYHNFHVPVWSRVFILDIKTLNPVGFGQKGFLNFVSPYITSSPAHSVVMGDIASLYPGSSCKCDLKTPYFIVHDRAGVSKSTSCAIAASELIKNIS